MSGPDISVVLRNLRVSIENEVGLLLGVDKEMRELESTLSLIDAVLDDADRRQHQHKAIQNWLRKLKDAAYEVSDILDECQHEAFRLEINGQTSALNKKVWISAKCRYYCAGAAANLFLFRRKIAIRMKDVIEVVNAIAQQRHVFNLREEEGFVGRRRRETGSYLTMGSAASAEVFGRQGEKDKIVELLLIGEYRVQLSVYPIITGMGGLGKTSTLAQMAFNDRRIDSHFELKIWVNVSQDFNVHRLMKQIIESTTFTSISSSSSRSSFDSMAKEVIHILSGKRYLLVLDDVWCEDPVEWDKLRNVLSCGSCGSCVVVTTRSERVAASITTSLHAHSLSEDDCWLLFRQQAFGPLSGNVEEERPELVAIGRQIVNKCRGVPLAAKALGGLLRFKREEKEWLSIKESDLWNVQEEECSILPALRLSYYNLPLELRHCFSYCAVFLKDLLIDKDKLIHLWMANGFIQSNDDKDVEDVGNDIWNELYARSFFHNVERDSRGKLYFEIHNLMHDLAQSVAGYECQTVVEAAETPSSSNSCSLLLNEKIRHATLVHKHTYESMCSEALNRRGSLLRTILFQHKQGSSPIIHSSSKFEFSWDFRNFASLRAFDASETRMMHLSESVGNSKLLRYLNLSKTLIKELPASLCSLYNLETLNLNDCIELRRLPENMHHLTRLRHVCLVNCNKIEGMPPELRKLTQLKTLSLFVVGGSSGLGELRYLDLGGELEIKHLERVRNLREVVGASLDGKHQLCVLRLHWSKPEEESQENLVDEQVIEALEPPRNVEVLTIVNYRGKQLPVWMGNPSVLRSVVHIDLRFCRNCLVLPALGQLPRLKILTIDRMEHVEYIIEYNHYFRSRVISYPEFPSLEKLYISNLPNLKGLSMVEEEEERREQQPFPRLNEMVIWRCPKLILPKLPALETLTIWHSTNATVTSLSKLTSLTSLHLHHNEDVSSFPNGVFLNLTRLEILIISEFRNLKVLPENMSGLVALKKLCIESCEKLACLPGSGSGIGSLRSLLEMEIYHCPKIVSLPDNFQTLTQLQSLKFSYCNPELKRRCENGEDWHKIAHVPQVIIEELK